MAPILLFPDPPPPELIQSLDMAGYAWKAVANAAVAAESSKYMMDGEERY